MLPVRGQDIRQAGLVTRPGKPGLVLPGLVCRLAGQSRIGPVVVSRRIFSTICRRIILRATRPSTATAPTAPAATAWLVGVTGFAGGFDLFLIAFIVTVILVLGSTVIDDGLKR